MKRLLFSVFLLATSYGLSQTTSELLNAARQFTTMPRETVDMIPFANGRPTFGSGTPFNDLEYTIMDFDYIDGENGGSDVFMPVDPSDQIPGSDSVKYIRCVLNTDLNESYSTGDRDRVILGTHEVAYPFFSMGADGIDNDYAVIQHFDYTNGSIQLKGNANDYKLLYATLNDNVATEGYYLFYTAGYQSNGSIDLIAFIFPCDDLQASISGNPPINTQVLCNSNSTLDLNDTNQFIYATPIDPNIAVNEGIVQYGSTGKDIVGGIHADDNGNTYLMGSTDGDLNGTSHSGNKIFLSKIDNSGNTVWTSSIPLPNGSLLFDAVTDSNYVYVCGRTLGALPGITNAGRWDGILLKLDINTGAIVATDQFGNAGIDGYGNIVLDDQGGLYVSGQGSPAGVSGTDDSYLIARHNTSDLSNTWRVIQPTAATGFSASAEAWGGLYFQAGATDREDRVVAAGWYIAQGGARCFISVYDNLYTASPSRPHSIVFNSNGPEADWVLDNVIDSQGNIYVAGFTSGNLGGTHMGQGDAYIRKYSPTLTNPQTFQFGTTHSDMVRKMEINDQDEIYLTGYTYGDLFGQNADINHATGDVFALKLDTSFNILASNQFGTPHEDRSYGALTSNYFYLGGMTEGTMTGQSWGSFDGYAVALDLADLSFQDTTLASTLNELTQIRIYPNPVKNVLNISGLNSVAEYQIFDLYGKKVLKGKTSGRIELSILSTGIYLVQLNSNDQKSQILKILKQ